MPLFARQARLKLGTLVSAAEDLYAAAQRAPGDAVVARELSAALAAMARRCAESSAGAWRPTVSALAAAGVCPEWPDAASGPSEARPHDPMTP